LEAGEDGFLQDTVRNLEENHGFLLLSFWFTTHASEEILFLFFYSHPIVKGEVI